MNFLGQLIGRASNTVNNDVVSPLNRLLGGQPQPQAQFTPAPMQKVNLVNPNLNAGFKNLASQVQTQQGNQARLQAQKQLQFSPAFTQNVVNAQPFVGNLRPNAEIKGIVPAGVYQAGVPNQIGLGPSSADPNTLLHEGLHRVYQTSPQVRQQFNQAYNKSVTPGLKNWLASRLNSYKGFSKGLDAGGVPIPNYDLSNINSLPPDLQNEVHSFVPEYYNVLNQGLKSASPQKVQNLQRWGDVPATYIKGQSVTPSPIQNYYKQYYKVP